MMEKRVDCTILKFILLVVLLILTAAVVYAPPNSQTADQPRVGQVLKIQDGTTSFGEPAIQAPDPNTLFIAYAEEGQSPSPLSDTKLKNIMFARSTDGGTAWTTPQIVARDASNRYSIRMSAPNAQTVFITYLDSSGDIKLLKSVDGGRAFNSMSTNIAHVPSSPDYSSINGYERTKQIADALDASFGPYTGSDGYGGCENGDADFSLISFLLENGLLRNSKKCTTVLQGLRDFIHNLFFTSLATDIALDALDDKTLFVAYIEPAYASAVVTGGGNNIAPGSTSSLSLKLAVSHDGGATWTTLSTINDQTEAILAGGQRIHIRAVNSRTLYVSYVQRSTHVPILAYSADGGYTWSKSSPEEGKTYRWLQAPALVVYNQDKVFLSYSTYDVSSRGLITSIKPHVAATTTNGRFWTPPRDVETHTLFPIDFKLYVLDDSYLVGTFTMKSGSEPADPYKIYLVRSNDGGTTWLPPTEVSEITPSSSSSKLTDLVVQSYRLHNFSTQSLTLRDSDTAAITYVGKEANGQPSVKFALVSEIFKSLCTNTVPHTNDGDVWQPTLLKNGNPCCGDQPRDQGFIGAAADGVNKFLCYKDNGGTWKWLRADAQDQHWKVRNNGEASAVSNSKEWLKCDSQSIGRAVPSSDPAYTYKAHIAKFYCEDRGSEYRFAECCVTPSVSTAGAAGNTAVDERVCEGGNTGAVPISPGGASTLVAAGGEKVFTQSDYLDFDTTLSANPLGFTDWRDYTQLDIHFSVSEDPAITLELLDGTGNIDFSTPLADHVVNTPLVGKWLHAQIVLPSLPEIKRIRFRYTSPSVPGHTYNNKLVVDKIYLVPSVSQAAFCSNAKYLDRSVESPWLTDLDKNNLDGSIPPEPAGKSACNAVAGFNWTGTRCCGDDNTPSTTEYYNDTLGSCWNGNAMLANESGMDVVLTTSKNGVEKNFTYYCPRANCTYPAPPGLPYNLTKSPAHMYDLYFVPQSTQVPILASNGLTITEPGLIEARHVAQQVITQDGKLYSCNPDTHILTKSIPLLCSIKQACDPLETELFGLSATSNAHAELATQRNYHLRLCCGGVAGVSSQCSGNYKKLLTLSDATNAHVGKPGQAGYQNDVCISVPQSTPLDCQFSQTSPGNGYSCLFSISGATNAHVGRCGAYSENMYCRSENTVRLTTTSPTCSVLGYSFCSPELGWSNASSIYPSLTIEARNRTILKSASPLGAQSSSCCSAASCWNGDFCASDQSAVPDPNNAEIYSNARCIAGTWTSTPLVFSWDKRNFGYCPSASQCLVDLDGDGTFNNNPSAFFDGHKPLCINDTQFILDNYCAASNWTTRTRLIALELLNLVDQTGSPSNYTLFCDDYNKALVDTNYGTVLESILGPTFSQFGLRNCFTTAQNAVPCVNNFCVLDYSTPSGPKKALGVSLNKAVQDPRSGFLAGLGISSNYCNNNNLAGVGLFKKCSNDAKVWYSPEINSTIYSREGVELYPQTTGILNWFKNLFTGIINWFTGSQPSSTGPDYAFVSNSSQFSKLYLSPRPLGQSTRAVQGFQESIGDNQFLLVKYTNFPASLCTYVQNKAQVSSFSPSLQLPNLVCVNQGNDTIIFTHDPAAMNLWQDLTSKLRIS